MTFFHYYQHQISIYRINSDQTRQNTQPTEQINAVAPLAIKQRMKTVQNFSWLLFAIAVSGGYIYVQDSPNQYDDDLKFPVDENSEPPRNTYFDISRYENEALMERLPEVKLYVFKRKIIRAIEEMKRFLTYGDEKNNIPSVDSFFLPYKEFHFTTRDMNITGYLQNVAFTDFSNFELEAFELILLPLHFKLDFRLDHFQIHGNYKIQGEVLDAPVDGIGKFISQIKNLTLGLYLRFFMVDDSYQIKEFIFDVKTLDVAVNYTNDFEGEGSKSLDQNLTLHVLEQLQFEYVPPVITATETFNRFFHNFSAADVFTFVTDFLKKY